ncbi:MAG: hypothetical protein IKW83_11215 [Muribaculaceae bacterium]|nr:hypothetical protein [Muribaculaceae bacterium]
MNNTISKNDAEMLISLQSSLEGYKERMQQSIIRIWKALEKSNWHDRQRRVLEHRLEELDMDTLFMHIDIENNHLQILSNKINNYNKN